MNTISEIAEMLLGVLEGMDAENRLRPGEKSLIEKARFELFAQMPEE